MPKWGCSNRGGQLPDGTPRLLGHRQDVAHLARHVLQVVSKVIWHTHMAITLSMSSSPANCDMMRGSRAPSRFGVGLRARENTPRSNRATEPLCPLQI